MSIKLKDIAKIVNGKIQGNPETQITGLAGIEDAREGDITFLASKKYLPKAEITKASAIVISKDLTLKCDVSMIIVPDANQAFARLAEHFYNKSRYKAVGIDKTARIAKGVKLCKDVYIGAYCVIEQGCVIGEKTQIHPLCRIGRDCSIGKDCVIYSGVMIYDQCKIGNNVIIHSGAVIGSDGFGYTKVNSRHIKIPQIGRVVIEDDVEIGANVTIARARLDKTIIKRGTKIDNLVHIAHNVVIGEDCVILAQTGIAGSSTIGNNVALLGQVGVTDHVKIHNGAIVTGRSGVSKDVPAGSIVAGIPAREYKLVRKEQAILRRVIDSFKGCKQKLLAHAASSAVSSNRLPVKKRPKRH